MAERNPQQSTGAEHGDRIAELVSEAAALLGAGGGMLTTEQLTWMLERTRVTVDEALMCAVVWQALDDLSSKDAILRGRAVNYFMRRAPYELPNRRWVQNYPFADLCLHFGWDQQAICDALGLTWSAHAQARERQRQRRCGSRHVA